MPRQVRWGILGCARIARLQTVPALLRCAAARLQAVASRDPAKLSGRSFRMPAKEFGTTPHRYSKGLSRRGGGDGG